MDTLFRIIIITGLAILFYASGPGLQTERMIYDLKMRYLDKSPPPSEVVIVVIDENTLDRVATEMNGLQWPYPRSFHARVLNHLASAGAKAVYFDIVFDAPSGFGEKDDFIFEESMRKIPTVLAGEFNGTKISPPLSCFIDHGALAGNISTPVDRDQRIRNMRNSRMLPSTFKEALSYFCFGLFTDSPLRSSFHEPIPTVEQALFSITHPDEPLPYSGFIHYFGPPGTVQSVSWVEVFNPELFSFKKNLFKDKTIFIGKAPSLSMNDNPKPDLFHTPLSHEKISGVELRTNTYMTLLSGKIRYLVPPVVFPLIFISWVILLSLGMIQAKTPVKSLSVLIFLLALLVLFNGFLFYRHWIMPLVPFILFGIFLYGTMLIKWQIKKRADYHLTRLQLLHHFPEPVAMRVLRNPDKTALEGQRKVLTLLLMEMEGLDTLSETLPPETVIATFKEHLENMAKAILDHEGTVDTYRGDGLLAFWGAPENQENHADLALKAATEMLRLYEEKTIKKQRQEGFDLPMRIGIHTGLTVTGDIGRGAFIDYTAIGNTVKTATRIKEVSSNLNVQVSISGECIDALKEGIPDHLFPMARIAIRGKKEPVNFYTISGKADMDSYNALYHYLTVMDQNEFGSAKVKLFDLLNRSPDFGPARFHHQKFISDRTPLLDETKKPYWRLDSTSKT